MRLIALIIVFGTLTGCASSDATLPRKQTCVDRYSRVFQSAQYAVVDMGGNVVHSDQDSGVILGRFDIEYYGFQFELNISVRRAFEPQAGKAEESTVSVKAVEVDVPYSDKFRPEELRKLEEQYLNRVRAQAQCGPSW